MGLDAVKLKLSQHEIVYGDASNGQWTLVRNVMNITTHTGEGEMDYVPTDWQSIITTLTFKRKSAYYVINILVPCHSIGALMMLVFVIPLESGEKVSFGITVLLAFSVFQVVIAGNMPKTSDSTAILGKFFILL